METKNALNYQTRCIVLVVFILLFFVGNTNAGEPLSKGESVYVSIYSNVYSGVKLHALELSGMLSIRNTDPKYSKSHLMCKYVGAIHELKHPRYV